MAEVETYVEQYHVDMHPQMREKLMNFVLVCLHSTKGELYERKWQGWEEWLKIDIHV